MNHIVEPGQFLSGRYQLTELCPEQPSQDSVELWSATDTLLGKPVRILALDPRSPLKQSTLDAARRSALVDNANLVRVLSVGDSPESAFVTLELPAGKQLSSYLETPLNGEQAWSILGTLSQVLAAAQERGLRHYQITPDRIWVSPTGSIALDGVGISAALAGTPASEVPSARADRLESRQLLGFTAGLLTGEFPTTSDGVDPAIDKALSTADLPEPLRTTLNRERDGQGATSPSAIVRELGTWPPVKLSLPTPEPPTSPSPAPAASPRRKSAFGGERFFSPRREDQAPSVEKFPKITAPLGGDGMSASPAESLSDQPDSASPAPISRWGGPKPTPASTPSAESPSAGVTSADTTASDEPASGPDELPAEAVSSRAESSSSAEASSATAEPPAHDVPSTGATAVFKKIVDPEESDGPADDHFVKAASVGFAAGMASEREAVHVGTEQEPEQQDSGAPVGATDNSADDAADRASTESEATSGSSAPEAGVVDSELGIPAQEPLGLTPDWVKPEEFAGESAPTPAPAIADSLSDSPVDSPAEAASENEVGVSPATPDESPSEPASDNQTDDSLTSGESPAEPPHETEVIAAAGTHVLSSGASTSGGGTSSAGKSGGAATPAEAPYTPDRPVTPAHPAAAAAVPPQPPAEATNSRTGGSDGDGGNGGERQYNPSKVFTIGTAIIVAIAFIWAAVTLFRPTTDPDTSRPTATPTVTAAPTGEPEPEPTETPEPEPTEDYPAPEISNVTLLNPEAAALDPSNVGEQDSPSTVGNTFDGNSGTLWRSWWYSNPDFVGKSGLGLEVTLAEETQVSEVNLAVSGEGGNVQWRSTSADAPSEGDVLAEGSMSSDTSLSVDDPEVTNTIVLWFNQLPTDDEGNYRISISEITVN
ncbi:MAG: hypothetical protein ACTH1Z_07760 [Ancrocorticia sp.]|uniref:hypothetical protein n=1 Tax=Ancrocorticia sp. TaxID=2593684 RepID=UPI003F92766D